jgi:hypothetical protein
MSTYSTLGKSLNGNKIGSVLASVTGTGAVVTGLGTLASAIANVTDSNSATPISVATQHSRVGGTVNLVVVDLTPVGPVVAVSAAAHVCDVLFIGH